MRIGRELLDRVVDHPRREAPNECCGVLEMRDGEVVSVHPLVNTAASPLRFEVDGVEVHRLLERFEAAGGELGGIYHSHTRSAPYPSQTDVNFAWGWPGVEWLIVGLADDEPEVRSYVIETPGGRIEEVEVEVR
jgi:[CysO sulfur-carrier protein]-S-L-cysteine hydrolase